MWLLEIVEQRSSKEMTESLSAALRTTPLDEAMAPQTRGFPIFWVLPVPLRTFLVLPAAALNEEQLAFIKEVHQRTRRRDL
jgi:hypothetical protein